jgi:hypothetical protein
LCVVPSPLSLGTPSRNRGVYFGHVYTRERNKRHIGVVFSVELSLSLCASSLVLQAGGNPSDSFAISNASGLEVHQIADAPKISRFPTAQLLAC